MMLRSDKENLSVSFQVPKTPAHGGHHAFKTPLAKKFATPGSTRVPLGGKSTNVGQQPLTTKKNQQTVKKSPASARRKRTTPTPKQSQTPTVAPSPARAAQEYKIPDIAEFGDWEVETIPPRPEPLPDTPLDAVQLDYDAVAALSKNPPPIYVHPDPKLDRSIGEMLDDIGDLDLDVQLDSSDEDSSSPAKTTRQPSRPLATRSLAARQPTNTSRPLRSLPSQSARVPTQPTRLPSFMAPTASARAKMARQPSIKHNVKGSNGPNGPNGPERQERADQWAVELTNEELEMCLDLE
uniref:ARAD1A13816p n=1 Tax=Blastobotrys adeninivorans TaxID=409370 RepID=A0A060T382_BLAAD